MLLFFLLLLLLLLLFVVVLLLLGRTDMTYAVDWALKAKYLSMTLFSFFAQILCVGPPPKSQSWPPNPAPPTAVTELLLSPESLPACHHSPPTATRRLLQQPRGLARPPSRLPPSLRYSPPAD